MYGSDVLENHMLRQMVTYPELEFEWFDRSLCARLAGYSLHDEPSALAASGRCRHPIGVFRVPQVGELAETLRMCSCVQDIVQRAFRGSIFRNWWGRCFNIVAHGASSSEDERLVQICHVLGRRTYCPACVKASKDGPKRERISPHTRMRILSRDGFRCCFCGSVASAEVVLQVDHIVPISRGGSGFDDNLQTLCAECNVGKGTDVVAAAQALLERSAAED
jgi:hypothetical protein